MKKKMAVKGRKKCKKGRKKEENNQVMFSISATYQTHQVVE